jgi:hypothetical protein
MPIDACFVTLCPDIQPIRYAKVQEPLYFHTPTHSYAVEHDALGKSTLDEEAGALMDALYPEIVAGNPNAIKPLKELARIYPDIPQLQNHLYTLYMMCGKRRRARRVLRELRKNHPTTCLGLPMKRAC